MSTGGHEWWTSGVRETDRGYGRRMVLDLLTGASMSTGSQGKSTSWWESHYFPSDIKVGSPVVHVLSSWGYSDCRPLSSHATLRLCFSPFLSSFSFLLSTLSSLSFLLSPLLSLSLPLSLFRSLSLFFLLLYHYHCLLSFAPRSHCSPSIRNPFDSEPVSRRRRYYEEPFLV